MKNKRSRGGLSRLTVAFALLALPFLQQCTQDKNLIVEPDRPVATIKLAVDQTVVSADDPDEITFTTTAYTANGQLVSYAPVTIIGNGTALSSNRFVTDRPGEYRFVAKSGHVSSNEVTVFVTDESDTSIHTLKLTANAQELHANGSDTLKLSVTAYNKDGLPIDTSGFDVYHGDQQIAELNFTTTQAGKHSFIAKLGKITSDSLFVEAKRDMQAAIIKLSASDIEVVADGKATVSLSVSAENAQGDAMSSAAYTLYTNDKPLDGLLFSTTEVGKHRIKARMGDTWSNEVIVTAITPAVGRIEIMSSTQLIIADGRSTATLEIQCYDKNGQAIDNPSTLQVYANGSVVKDNNFKTTTPGEQRLYATVGQTTSNELIIIARQNKQYDIVTIPVIFHIGHFGESAGSGSNLPASMIQAVLDDMNRGYANGMGSTNPNAVDMRIRFRLAQTDETGKTLAEKGIVRTNLTSYDNGKGNNIPFNRELGLTEWREWQTDAVLAPELYYNIWVYPAEENWAGLANYPSMNASYPLSGITTFNPGQRAHYINTHFNYPAPRISSKYRSGLNATVIHEVGHTLGLRHTFSDNNCSTADYCEDTYSYNYPHIDQPCPDNKGAMIANENFMDYRGSRNTFTYDQRERVQHTIKHGLWFAELIKSSK